MRNSFEIQQSDSYAVIARKLLVRELVLLAGSTGLSAGALTLGATALTPAGAAYSDLASIKGAAVGALTGMLTASVSMMARFIYFACAAESKELGLAGQVLAILAHLGVFAGCAAASSKMLGVGKPEFAAADAITGGTIIAGAAFLIAGLVMCCYASCSNRSTQRYPRNAQIFAEHPAAMPAVEVREEDPERAASPTFSDL